MAITDVFKKKGSDLPLPVDKVMQMKQQGMTSTQITEALQREGYSVDQIFQALNHVEVKGGIEGASMAPQPNIENPMVFPAPQPEPIPFSQPQQAPQPQQYQQQETFSVERIEEIAEAIIDEKWKELVKQVNKIIDWKEKTEEDITSLKTEFEAMKKEFDQLKVAILEKVGEYDKNIKNVSTDLKALQQVFKDMLPGFVENVQELSKITSRLKEK